MLCLTLLASFAMTFSLSILDFHLMMFSKQWHGLFSSLHPLCE
jgi:hypothetical protein